MIRPDDKFIASTADPAEKYCKGTTAGTQKCADHDNEKEYANSYIQVAITAGGKVTITKFCIDNVE